MHSAAALWELTLSGLPDSSSPPTQIVGSCSLLSPQSCSVRLELAFHISVNRISQSSRGKVKKNLSLFQLAYENILV